MLTHYFSSRRNIWLTSIFIGIAAALLAGVIQSIALYHSRTERLDTIINNISTHLTEHFSELNKAITHLQTLADQDCQSILSSPSAQTIFELDVSMFMLIKRGHVICSSTTGAINVPLTQIIPQINPHKALDLQLLSGSSGIPRARLAMWLRSSDEDQDGVYVSMNPNLIPYLLYSDHPDNFSKIALVVDDKAIFRLKNSPVDLRTLPDKPTRQIPVQGLPLKLSLYTSGQLSERNMQFILLLSVVCGVLAGFAGYYIMAIKCGPRKILQTAMKNHQFYLVYQPVVKANSLQIVGVEVLMRWHHPAAGEIPPDVFIRLAEKQQMIVPLTHHLLTLLALDAPMLQTILPAGSKLGINISPAHLQSSCFQHDIQQFVAALPEGHFNLVLEMTERAMIDTSQSEANFDWLHRQGVEIAIDDFGTGHSALIYLERYNFDFLKIDRRFVQGIDTETVTSPVLDAVLKLSRHLQLTTVAEGVETPEQAEWLTRHGVDYLQGYWLSQPLRLEALIAAHKQQVKYFTG
ncbi:cyclic di-GMP phosphodiesterase [Enterobacteriaceae bacterium ESL0689]|nr:cyclic di-GMP phosphodiesterase [Enterobacteriaceae bacterium ESL0689]